MGQTFCLAGTNFSYSRSFRLNFLPQNIHKQVLILAFWVVLAKIAKFSTLLK